MSVGPYCDLNQDVDSKDYKHGAVVSLVMDENERECKLMSVVKTKIVMLPLMDIK